MERRAGRASAGRVLTGCVAVMVVAVVGSPASATAGPGPVGASTVLANAQAAVGQDADASVYEELRLVVPPVVAGAAVAGDASASGLTAADDAVLAARVAPSADRVLTDAVPLGAAQTVGVTWPADAQADGLDPQLRVREDGLWSPWRDVPVEEVAPDPGSADAAGVRGGTEPVWVGDSADAVQLSFAALPTGGPADMALVLVGSPLVESGAAAVTPAAQTAGDVPLAAAAAAPTVISRATWGASPQVCTPDVASRLVGAVLHHTAGSNAYSTQAEAMQQLRNDQRYHITSRGWCDLGYNFVVDKWGNIYEGRADSGSKPVIGVHAGGFNTGTVGISMLGSYGTVSPPPATVESVSRVVAWRLGQYHRDPAGTFVYHTLGGENSKYPAGADVTLPVVFAHRDVANTACPGVAGFATLPDIRSRARHLIGASFIDPAVSPASAPPGTTVTLRATTLGDIEWHLVVADARTGVVVDESTGTARASSGGVVATWDGRNPAGTPVGPGPYSFTLTGSEVGTGVTVVPSVTTATVTKGSDPPTVPPVPLVGDLHFVPITPARVLDTRPAAQALGAGSRTDVVVAGVAGVPADAKAVAVNITAVNPSAITFVRAWPAGQSQPATSVLNTDAGRAATAAGTILAVGGEGKISLWNNAGSTHLVVDVTGYYTTTGSGGFGQLATAVRALDTRTAGGSMSDGDRRTVTVAGRGGVPTDADAVVVNVTSVVSRGNGYVSVVPTGSDATQTSAVNHLPGSDVTNRVTVPLAGGRIDVLVGGSTADVVIDVVGWYGPSGTGQFTPIVPARAFDTRTSGGPLGQGATRTFAVGGPAGLPASATSVLMALTATQQSSPATYLTAWPAGLTRPGTSDLNTGHGRDQANGVLVGLGTGAAIQVFNNLGSTQVIGDVYGYFD